MSKDKIQELDNLLAGLLREPPLISTNLETQPPAFADQPKDQPSTVEPTVVSAADSARHVEQSKALLIGLGRETAIRLRWAMRDIRGQRTKMTPVSPNDLAALTDLGFVETHEGIPRLTDLGELVLN